MGDMKMNYRQTFRMTFFMVVVLAGLIGLTAAATVIVGGGQISPVGNQIDVPVTLDSAPNGLSYYKITAVVADPSVAIITGVKYPAWVNSALTSTGPLPAGSVSMKGADLSGSISPGSTNVPLATITVQGLKAGTTTISTSVDSMFDVNFSQFGGTVGGQPGTVQVTGNATPTPTVTTTTPATTATTVVTTSPTTQPTTTVTTTSTETTMPTTEPTSTETTVVTTSPTTQPTTPVTTVPTTAPTTSPPSGPTGSVYLSTTPTGANIYIDGSSTPSGTTPAIIMLSVGTHHASLRLDGYKDVPVYFEVEQDMTTIIAPRTLVPGIGVMTDPSNSQLTITTNPTTVITTIPTNAVVNPTPSGNGLFGWLDPSKLIQRLTSFGSNFF